jgi:hypothetical protein
MSNPDVRLLVRAAHSDERLRKALDGLDALAHARVVRVSHEVERVAAVVLEQTAAAASVGTRRVLHRHAWLAVGLCIGIGVMLGHASRR